MRHKDLAKNEFEKALMITMGDPGGHALIEKSAPIFIDPQLAMQR
ncbi:MAG: hypothetical protein RJA29_965 [Pseudomonadota bacterium]|jgi:hypothetical protein